MSLNSGTAATTDASVTKMQSSSGTTPVDDLFAAVQNYGELRKRTPVTGRVHGPPFASVSSTSSRRVIRGRSADGEQSTLKPTVAEHDERHRVGDRGVGVKQSGSGGYCTRQLPEQPHHRQMPDSRQQLAGTVDFSHKEPCCRKEQSGDGVGSNKCESRPQRMSQPQPMATAYWTPASASYRLKRYDNVPMKIADYEPGVSSLALNDPTLSNYYNPPVEKPGDYCKYVDLSSDVRYRIQKKQRSLSPSLSDSSIHQQYRKVQMGGEIPINGLRCPTPPSTPKQVPKYKAKQQTTQSAVDDLIDRLLEVELKVSDDIDPPRTSDEPIVSSDVTISSPLSLSTISQRRRRTEIHAARKLELELILAEERRKRLEQDARINMARRHSACFVLPNRCAPVALDRYSGDEFDQISFTTSIPRRSPSVGPATGGLVRAKAQAIYSFHAENNRELSLRKGDIVYLNRAIDDNWLEGEHHGLVGIFPANYVEVLVSIEDANAANSQRRNGLVQVAYDFNGQTPLELSLRKGEWVTVLRQLDNNWYEGRVGNRQGLFPVSYVEAARTPSTSLSASTSTSAWSMNMDRTHVDTPALFSCHRESGDESRPSNRQSAISPLQVSNPLFQPGNQPAVFGDVIYRVVAASVENSPRNARKHLSYSSHSSTLDTEDQLLSNERPLSSVELSSGIRGRRHQRSKSADRSSVVITSDPDYLNNGTNGRTQINDVAFPVENDVNEIAIRGRDDNIGGSQRNFADGGDSSPPPPPLPRRQYRLTTIQGTTHQASGNRSSCEDFDEKSAQERSERGGDGNSVVQRDSSSFEMTTDKGMTSSTTNDSSVEPAACYRSTTSTDDVALMTSSHKLDEIGLGVIKYTPYYVVYPYSPCDEDELALAAGDIVYVTESFDDGWLVGISQRTNEYGSFPSTCVCKLRTKQLPRQNQRYHHQRQQLSMPIEL